MTKKCLLSLIYHDFLLNYNDDLLSFLCILRWNKRNGIFFFHFNNISLLQIIILMVIIFYLLLSSFHHYRESVKLSFHLSNFNYKIQNCYTNLFFLLTTVLSKYFFFAEINNFLVTDFQFFFSLCIYKSFIIRPISF